MIMSPNFRCSNAYMGFKKKLFQTFRDFAAKYVYWGRSSVSLQACTTATELKMDLSRGCSEVATECVLYIKMSLKI